MDVYDSRRRRQALVLLAVLALTLAMLSSVLGTLFFAATVASVLLPAKRALRRRGASNRLATAVVTASAFVGALALVAPLLVAVYQRRRAFFEYLRTLPKEYALSGFGLTYVVEVDAVTAALQSLVADAAVGLASTSLLLLTKLFLFAFVVYALLLRPEVIRRTVVGVVPPSHEPDLWAFYDRIRRTLNGIYVVQAATAVGTFLVALPVFFLLGYDAFFTLAVLSGLLQFVPILGPSVLLVGVAAANFVAGDATGAALTLVVGLVFVATLPDVVIRPLLAERTADLAPSLYFVGFVAGGLSYGAVGVIAGPVVIGVLIEAVAVVSRPSADDADAVDPPDHRSFEAADADDGSEPAGSPSSSAAPGSDSDGESPDLDPDPDPDADAGPG